MTTDEHPDENDETTGAPPSPESGVEGQAPGADAVAADDDVLAAVDADADEPSVPEEPDFQDLYLRAAAETDNVRKRARRDVEQANARGVARLARELLPALDNLDRALAATESADADSVAGSAAAEPAGSGAAHADLVHGIRLVQQELLGALTRVGIEQFSPDGEQFDPHQHEAMAQVAVDGKETGAIVQVFQVGYRYKDEILRPARVAVCP